MAVNCACSTSTCKDNSDSPEIIPLAFAANSSQFDEPGEEMTGAISTRNDEPTTETVKVYATKARLQKTARSAIFI